MKSKNLVLFVVFLAVVFFVITPYMRFVIQRHELDSGLAAISLDYSTMGRERFERRLHEICAEARLHEGSYEFEVVEDTNKKNVTVTIRYRASFKVFFVERTEDVVLTNEFTVYDL